MTPEIGTRTTCAVCGRSIVFVGPYWDHVPGVGGSRPRHIASPAKIGATRAGTVERVYFFGAEYHTDTGWWSIAGTLISERDPFDPGFVEHAEKEIATQRGIRTTLRLKSLSVLAERPTAKQKKEG